MSNSINVVMVGPKGAGKTSILSAMLHDVDQFISKLTQSDESFRRLGVLPSLTAIGQAHGTLKDGHQLLKNLASSARKTGDGPTASVDMSEGEFLGDNTSRCSPVLFKMGTQETTINFWDFPGGFYSVDYLKRNEEKGFRSIPKEDIPAWETIVQNADVILLTVDASTQLGDEPFLKDKTYYSRITELVKASIRHSMTTLVFVPVKCEHMAIDATYDEVQNEIDTPLSNTGCKDLRKKVEALFPDLVKFVRDSNVWGNVDAFFVPMITVGGIKCNGRTFDPSKLMGTIRFSPIIPAHYAVTPFKPQNCEKVFALCLLRAYKPLVNEWQANASIWAKIKAYFAGKTPFEVFFDKLSESIHFLKMFCEYFVSNPDFLNSQGETGKEMQSVLEEYVKKCDNDKVPEDGCATLNPVYWPTNIR